MEYASRCRAFRPGPRFIVPNELGAAKRIALSTSFHTKQPAAQQSGRQHTPSSFHPNSAPAWATAGLGAWWP
eukprot:1157809-Pelagomonas_calceolata.AAC.2